MSDLARPATYRTFHKVEETLSPAEQRFERLRRTVGLAAGPAVALVVYLLCTGLDEPAQRMLRSGIVFDGIAIIVAGVTMMANVLG